MMARSMWQGRGLRLPLRTESSRLIAEPRGKKGRGTEPHRHHEKSKETHEVTFLWLSWLAVVLVGAYTPRRRQHGGHNRNEAKFIFVSFLWLGPIDSGVDEISSKNEREREESRARMNRDRSSQEDRERERARLKERKRKWY